MQRVRRVHEFQNAREICEFLSNDGSELGDIPVNSRILAEIDEVYRKRMDRPIRLIIETVEPEDSQQEEVKQQFTATKLRRLVRAKEARCELPAK